jgi:Tol biopolymer transport system component
MTHQQVGVQGGRGALRAAMLIAAAWAMLGFFGLPAASEAAFPVAANGKIAYQRYTGSSPYDVWLMNPDGSSQVNLTNTPEQDEGGPAFSPNGRRIAFVRCEAQCDIFVMNADGSAAVNLTNTPVAEERPDFSPDGKQIVFERADDVFIMQADGTGQVNLTNSPQFGEGAATFSPDGRRVAFGRCDIDTEICTISAVNVDGTGLTNLTPGTGFGEGQPALSPDGRRLAFVREHDVFVANTDGSGEMNLTNTPVLPVSGAEHQPVFSPDGRLIAFERFLPDSVDLFAMNVDGSAQANLSRTATPDYPNEYASNWQYVYRCAGRRATIVGDDGPDKIKGTKRADVIVANGGKDRIKGRGGRDRICGGSGKDRIGGGKGNDRCVGGPGRDAGSCEKGRL